MSKQWIVLATLLGGALAGGATWWFSRELYVSQGMVGAFPPLLPESVMPADAITARDVNLAAQNVLSRAGLRNEILTNDLYGGERLRLPMEDVLEQMRKEVKIAPLREGSEAFKLSFGYADPVKAQKVAQNLISRLLDEVNRAKGAQAQAAVDFLQDRILAAEKEKSPDAGVARRQLEVLHLQLAQMKMRLLLQGRSLGARAVMLDPASLPEGNWVQMNEPWSIMGAVLLGMALAGIPVWLVARRRSRSAAA